jgi:TM2 domain-containing membrane protein YozV
MASSKRDGGLATIFSFLLPGMGQLYTGHIFWAIFWFIFTPGLWIGSGGLLGWICHILSACQANRMAR